MSKYILALDQGTTSSSRAILFDRAAEHRRHRHRRNLPSIYPKEGWVEHDPMEIWSSQYARADGGHGPVSGVDAGGHRRHRHHQPAGDHHRLGQGDRAARSTTPSCGSAAARPTSCDEPAGATGWADHIRARPPACCIDAYFSATKIKWILDHVEGARERAERGETPVRHGGHLAASGSSPAARPTSPTYTNASRTMLFNIHTLDWDKDILLKRCWTSPWAMLPEVRSSSEVYGYAEHPAGPKVPIAGIAGRPAGGPVRPDLL